MDFNFGLLLAGLLFFSVGVLLLINHLKSKRKNTESATATVIDYITERKMDSDSTMGSIVYYPVMRYYAGGQWYEQRQNIGRGDTKYEIGETVEIMYNPDKPEDFIVSGDNLQLIISVIGTIIGVGLLLLAFFEK